MASSTITLKDKADANVVYDLVGQTPTSAVYTNSDRTLGLPEKLTFTYKVGAPGSKGNDRIMCKLENCVEDGDGLVSTGSVTVTLSVPRNSAWTTTFSEDLLIQLQDLFTDANSAVIALAQTP